MYKLDLAAEVLLPRACTSLQRRVRFRNAARAGQIAVVAQRQTTEVGARAGDKEDGSPV
ncbi:hypothetical protein OAP28_03540 [Planktomarina sp.]|nr:hypothetical protein [Planktomarina sp.]